MADTNFVERENVSLHAPALKMRQRLQSAPDNILRTPIIGKKFHTPLTSGRKALGVVNKITSTPATNGQEKKCQKTQEAKVKCVSLSKVEEYPDIEKFIPYDPLEFEKHGIPKALIRLSCLALPGLAFPQTPRLPEEDFEPLEPFPQSPWKIPQDDCAAEFDAFLQTINALTIDLPPESD